MRITYPFVILSAIAVLVLGPGSGSAGTEIFDDTPSTCTNEPNCDSLRIPGSVFSINGHAKPWVVNIFADDGQCLRLDVISQDTDLRIVAVAPNGQVFQNDDRDPPTDLRPLVTIDPAPRMGYYTVHIAHFDGEAVEADFVLLHGLYNSGNAANCVPATQPAMTGNPGSAK
jgi:hypothetical protein